ncbi:alanine racemase [Streptomyces scabiei]|uniref:alanine racemase n=1 Tax=Streptomyces scabiei TaxID=1930 RepID=UPI0029904E00|nr:alanine racemase [Streptomyces scabiei]MDW8803618.1 alanine racemase [Streptomyces scabiei]
MTTPPPHPAPADTVGALSLADPDTPFAVLDTAKATHNIARLADHVSTLGVSLRPHLKTAKSLAVAALIHGDTPGPITVSTLAEAEAFADGRYTDILYAVGIAPHKLPRVIALLQRGITLSVLLDSAEQARAVRDASAAARTPIPALIEVDCDGHRGGVTLQDPTLVEIGRILAESDSLAGVLVHAGESYFAGTRAEQRKAADHERDVAVAAAQQLREAGLRVDTVSVGSTPTAHAATDLTGVTEVRAGNYVFFDLVMAGLGVCEVDDLALSVVVTVIGHRPEHGWILTDGGWMAMSRDRGTANQRVDQGYGLVTDLNGNPVPQLLMSGASQEHGILSTRDGSPLPDLPVGTRLRVLPNHACATAAQHHGYHVIDSSRDTPGTPVIQAYWGRVTGW